MKYFQLFVVPLAILTLAQPLVVGAQSRNELLKQQREQQREQARTEKEQQKLIEENVANGTLTSPKLFNAYKEYVENGGTMTLTDFAEKARAKEGTGSKSKSTFSSNLFEDKPEEPSDEELLNDAGEEEDSSDVQAEFDDESELQEKNAARAADAFKDERPDFFEK